MEMENLVRLILILVGMDRIVILVDFFKVGGPCAPASQVTRMQLAPHEQLEKMRVEMSMNFNCGMSKTKYSLENFKIDIRTEIMKEMNKSQTTEVQSGFRNEGCEERHIYKELASMK